MNAADIKRVLVVGAGESGVQIALQFARFEYSVQVLDISQDRLKVGRSRQCELLRTLVETSVVHVDQLPEIESRITYWDRKEDATRDVQLVCESVNEDLNVKRSLFRELDAICPRDTIFTTNTSYLLPSSMAHASGRPERLAAFHFHVPVWIANAVDIMPHPRTSSEVVDTLEETARRIGQVPIVLRRENPGYVFNAILHPLVMSGLDLAAREVADLQTVDRAWMAVTKMPIGPFGITDKIGLDTVYKIVEQWAVLAGNKQAKRVMGLLATYLEQQRLGEKNQAGFYDYPSPEYGETTFLEAGLHSNISTTQPDGALNSEATRAWTPVSQTAPISARIKNKLEKAGHAIVLGTGPDADIFCKSWSLAGGETSVVRLDSSIEEILAWFSELHSKNPITTFVIFDSTDEPPNSDQHAIDRWFESTTLLPYRLVQCWFRFVLESDSLNDVDFLTISRGDLNSGAPSTAALAKAVLMESMSYDGVGLTARAICLEPELTPEVAVQKAISELAVARRERITGQIEECRRRQANVEVALCETNRMHRRFAPAPNNPGTLSPKPTGTWIVSGGAKGIGRRAALSLAKRYQLDLCLLGRTEEPESSFLEWSPEKLAEFKAQVMRNAYHDGQKPNKAWTKYSNQIELEKGLQSYRREGIDVTYFACDVSNQAHVQAIVSELQSSGRTINGVLHAAGVEQTARFEAKSTSSSLATLGPKILGTLALQNALADRPPAWFVSFGSLAGQLGGVGQVDYVLANDQMARLMRRWQGLHPNVRCVTFHWPGWDEIGMAARPSSRFMLEKMNQHLMPVSEGVEHFLNEFEAGQSATDVVICRDAVLGSEFQAHAD